MFEKVIGKCTEVIVKNGAKIVVAGVGAAVTGTVSVISYNIGKKKGDEEGRKSASEIYVEKFKVLATLFD